MKKLSISLAFLCAVCLGGIVLESCSKSTVAADPAAVCTASGKSLTDAATAYSNAPTDKTKCQAYKDAASKYLSDCAIYASAADINSAKASVNSII